VKKLYAIYRFLFEEKAPKRTVAAPLLRSNQRQLPECLDHEIWFSMQCILDGSFTNAAALMRPGIPPSAILLRQKWPFKFIAK